MRSGHFRSCCQSFSCLAALEQGLEKKKTDGRENAQALRRGELGPGHAFRFLDYSTVNLHE